MSESKTFNHPNGYCATLYGKSSMSVFYAGKEVSHTGSRNVNTEDEVMEFLERFPGFFKAIADNIDDILNDDEDEDYNI